MDFLLANVKHSFREKVQAVETLSDNVVTYYFGQSSPVWSYTGALINTVQDDQVTNFVRLYLHVLRGTQLARRQKSVSLRYDSFIVNGTIESLDWELSATTETFCPFAFTFRVKRFGIIYATDGWVPTRPHGPIADPDAIAFDGVPRSEGSVEHVAARTPSDATEENPSADAADGEQSSNADVRGNDTTAANAAVTSASIAAAAAITTAAVRENQVGGATTNTRRTSP
jgi:hypothetical protein